MTILVQVERRLKEAGRGWVRYLNGKFIVGENTEISVATGAPGDGSGDITQDVINAADPNTTIADADKLPLTDSEASGLLKSITGFDFKAWIVAHLLTLDFVRVNASKDLLSGSNIVVTQAATGMRYGFLAAINHTVDPTAGLFKSSVNLTATIPAANSDITIAIDSLDKNNTDMGAFMSAWLSGGTMYVRSAASTDISFMVISIVSVANQDPDTFYHVTGKYLGGSLFSGGESCVIQYIPPTNVAAAIDGVASKATPVDADKLGLVDSAASGALKYLSWANLKAAMNTALLVLGYTRIDASGNLIKGDGSAIDGVNTVYALVSAPVSGVTPLPEASDVTNGTVVAIHPDCFVGAGANAAGIMLRSLQSLNQWRPPCDTVEIFSKTGTLAAPIFTMTSATQAGSNKFDVGVDTVIPGGLLYPGSKLILKMHFRRNVVSPALGTLTLRAYLGKNATLTGNSIVWQGEIADSNDRDMLPEAEISLTSLTVVESTRNLSRGGPGLSQAAISLNTQIDFAVDQKLTFHIVPDGSANLNTLDANNTIDLISFSVTFKGQ